MTTSKFLVLALVAVVLSATFAVAETDYIALEKIKQIQLGSDVATKLAAEDLEATDDLTVGDDAAVGGDLTVTGTSSGADVTATDDVTAGDDLVVTDDASIGGILGVTGVATFTAAPVLVDISISGTNTATMANAPTIADDAAPIWVSITVTGTVYAIPAFLVDVP